MTTSGTTFWISLLYLAAGAQGFFLSAVLAGRKQNSTANHVLAVAMLLFSFELLSAFYHGSGLDRRFPHLIGATYVFPFLYSPIFLLYAQTLTRSIPSVRVRELWHFVPTVIVLIYTLPFYGLSGQEKLLILDRPEASSWTERLFFIDHMKFAYSLIYLMAILVVIDRHRRRVREKYSTLDRVNLDWLRFLAFGGLATWLVALAFYISGLFDGERPFDPIEGHSDYVSLAVAAYVYAIGYMGLRQPEIFSPERAAVDRPTETASYARSGIDERQAKEIEHRALDLMVSEAPFRDPDLTLSQLATRLGVTPHNLSQVINSRMDMNFYDFVNTHRVKDVQRRIAEDTNAALTLLSIGLDSGFKSKSSFNAVFKKIAGCTPSEYRRRTLSGRS